MPQTFTKSLTVGPTSLEIRYQLKYGRPVHKSASEQDIRHAYKKLSRKYHPDKNKEPDAEDRFVEIAHGEQNASERYTASI